jgi:hypothetical protein
MDIGLVIKDTEIFCSAVGLWGNILPKNLYSTVGNSVNSRSVLSTLCNARPSPL